MFPSAGYELAGGPEIEVYDATADITDEKHSTEIWIPVKKKYQKRQWPAVSHCLFYALEVFLSV
ncbi:GyrI-like domain-containing protein [Bacillus sp. YC2]|uniref:GyrI-like domain-containing protein n=1 Tax=Bacillus sp. YC2 TaxID=2861287 RepID=UPI001CA719D7|nr:GyrI-like domain-containing protein [Bacillus sp. YC2]